MKSFGTPNPRASRHQADSQPSLTNTADHFKNNRTSNDKYGQFDKPKPPAFDVHKILNPKDISMIKTKVALPSNKPIKVYSDSWYQSIRPSATIEQDRIVDTQLTQTMNTQIEIEKDMRDILAKDFKISLNRQISPSKNMKKKKAPKPKKIRYQSAEQSLKSIEEQQNEKPELPYEIIKQIDTIVDKHMVREFPMKKYVSKKEKMIAFNKDSSVDHTWSSKLLNQQLSHNGKSTFGQATPARISRKSVDPVERENAMKEWKYKKHIAKQLKDHYVGQALENIEHVKMQEQLHDQNQQNQSSGAYEEWQHKKKIENLQKKQLKLQKKQEEEMMKQYKQESTKEAFREWCMNKQAEKIAQSEKDTQKKMRQTVKQERQSREKAERSQQCKEQFALWAGHKCQHIKANPKAFDVSSRLAISKTRKMKQEKYGDQKKQDNEMNQSTVILNFNPLQVKQAAKRPVSAHGNQSKLKSQPVKPNIKHLSMERQLNTDLNMGHRKGTHTKKNTETTLERETQASNTNKFSSAHRDRGAYKRGGSERDSSRERQMKLQMSNKFISSEQNNKNSNMRKSSSNGSFQDQPSLSNMRHTKQDKSGSVLNQDMAHLTNDGSTSNLLGYGVHQPKQLEPTGSHVQRMRQQMEQRRQAENNPEQEDDQMEEEQQIEESYSEDDFEEVLGDEHDVYGDELEEEDDPELFYDPAEEEMVSGSGSDSMGYPQSHQQIFVQESAGASTNCTGNTKTFGNGSSQAKKINNFF